MHMQRFMCHGVLVFPSHVTTMSNRNFCFTKCKKLESYHCVFFRWHRVNAGVWDHRSNRIIVTKTSLQSYW